MSSSLDSLPKSVRPYFEHLASGLAPEDLASLQAEFLLSESAGSSAAPLPGSESHWRDWLTQHFPHVTTAPFAERHVRLWERFEALTPGARPRPVVELWGRGGAKSTTVQLCCVRSCVKLSRRFALYVSGTSDQVDKHLASVSNWMERIGIQRSINKYGVSRGWNAQQLRTSNGWNMVGIGLDQAIRGAKLEEFRPDLIIFDDVDSHEDTLQRISDKIETLTRSIIPSGSTDCAYFVVQNVVHPDGIASQLLDGRADWLMDREVHLEPAAHDLEIESKWNEAIGKHTWYVTKGTPTWPGQDLKKIEEQVNSWGKRAFLIEAQHEVKGAQGLVFDVDRLLSAELSQIPKHARRCEAWDLAGTEGGGDFTARVRMSMVGEYPTVTAYIEEVEAGQWGTDRVRMKLKNSAVRMPKGTILRLPRDPGQAGVFQANQLGRDLKAHAPRIRPVSGSKATRARGLAECINLGNCHLVRGSWMTEALEGSTVQVLDWFLDVLRRFTEDDSHEIDDPVDAAADAFNELALHPDPTQEERTRDANEWLPEALKSEKKDLQGRGDGLGIEEAGSVRMSREAETLTGW